jgi:hypothetical protein
MRLRWLSLTLLLGSLLYAQTPIPGSVATLGSDPSTCSSSQIWYNAGSGVYKVCWPQSVAGLPTPTVDSRSDTGANSGTICGRIYDLQANYTNQTIDARGDLNTSSLQNCGAVDINSSGKSNGVLFGGGGAAIQTDTGFHIGAFDQVIGSLGNVTGYSGSPSTSGTIFQTTSNFPASGSGSPCSAGVAVCTSGTNSSGSATLTLVHASGGEALILSPGAELLISGETACTGAPNGQCRYLVKTCSTNGAPCYNGPNGFSQFYNLPSDGTTTAAVTISCMGTGCNSSSQGYGLQSSPSANTTVTVLQPVFGMADTSVLYNASGSFYGAIFQGGEIACASSTGVAQALNSGFGQENSRAQDWNSFNCSRGLVLTDPTNSGPWRNFNWGTSTPTNCRGGSSQFAIPVEIWGNQTVVERGTINGNNCGNTTSDAFPYGMAHITNVPGNTGFSDGGGFDIHEIHGEGACTAPSGTNCSASNVATANLVLLDSLNSGGSPPTGPVAVHDLTGGPTNFPTTNVVKVDSSFKGTLFAYNIPPNAGVTNYVNDAIASNVITKANDPNGLGFYFLDASGGAKGVFTNANSSSMSNGWDVYNGVLAGYSGSTATLSFNAVTGVETVKSIKVSGSAPTCIFTGVGLSPGCALQTGSTDTAGVIQLTTGSGTIGSNGSVTITFSTTFGTNNPVCMMTPSQTAVGQWQQSTTVTASFMDKTPGTSSDVQDWQNGSTALLASKLYYVNYICFAK